MKPFLLLLIFGLITFGATAQQSMLNIPAMHQLISESETEYARQTTARNRQTLVTANEKANLTLLDKVKVKYRELQQRYNTLGLAINLADIGINATPMVKRIISNQSQIIALAHKNPALIAIGYDAQLTFVAKAKSLSGYVAGLTISFGDVNQMKASDRKILFDFVLAELSSLQELSGNMVNMMQYANVAGLLRAANPFQNFVNADKQIAGEILQNAKYLK
jgi:hypothetical protein